MLADITETVEPPERDSIRGLFDEGTNPPTIVSISDVHGYLQATRSALTSLSEHPSFEPVVVADEDGRLHWANGNYVLVFNGDLVDRGPANEDILALVSRLATEAPPGRVRVTLGNHEAIALSPDHFGFSNWYSGQVSVDERRALLERIVDGHVVAAYRGHNVVYAHAGAPDPYEPRSVNESLIEAAQDLLDAIGTPDDRTAQRHVLEEYSQVLGVGTVHPKGPGAGLIWLDFQYLPADASPQVVGHTRHDAPRQSGNVFCQNVIRNNIGTDGGEAVFVETPDTLCALLRDADGEVSRNTLANFQGQ